MTPIRGLNLKKLFGKLTPYADDVARGVSNYGDNVARAVGNYGDDALRLASNYGDDALQLTSSAAGNQLFNMAGVADGNGYTADQLFNKLRVAAENSGNLDAYAETLNDLYKYTDAYNFADGWTVTDDVPWWQHIVQKRNRKPMYDIDDELPF